MGGYKKFKRGFKGENQRFITRNEAAKKLQVSLQIFRKLCILKGIHPRNPKKKLKGHNKTYYYAKDIRYLQHERLISIIRERRAAKEKATKLKSRKEFGSLASLKEKMPEMNLDHIVKERYPTFNDALKDLDDCLSLVHLFANLDSSSDIKKHHITTCERLAREFQYYVMKTNSLKKVFASVKGIYYQAQIQGETVTWLTPMNYLNKKERNVDYGVMINFLEFYETLLKFVNYRLFTSIGIEYPLSYDRLKLRNAESFTAIVEKSLRKDQNDKKINTGTIVQKKPSNVQVTPEESKIIKKVEKLLSKKSQTQEEEIMDVDQEEENILEITSKGVSKDFENLIKEEEEIVKIVDTTNLFKGFIFFINREVSKPMMEFIIRSFGGEVAWDGIYNESDQKITHQVVDRKANFAGSIYPTREYIQPQWIFDSVNNGIILPYQEYNPTVVPPPHLSPFTVYDETSYIPQRKAALDALINQQNFDSMKVPEQESDDEANESEDEKLDDEDEDNDNLLEIENKYLNELESEKNRKAKDEEEDEEDVEMEGSDDEKMQVEEQPVVKKTTKRQREEEKKKQQEAEETKLAEMMIKKKDKWIYKKIQNSNAKKQANVDSLEAKRKLIESGKDINARERSSVDYVPKKPQEITPKPVAKNNQNKNNNKSKSNSTKPSASKKVKVSK